MPQSSLVWPSLNGARPQQALAGQPKPSPVDDRRRLPSSTTIPGVSDHDLLFSKKEREAPEQAPAAAGAGPSGRAPPAAGGSGGWGAGASATGGRGAGVSAGAGASPRKGLFSKTATQGWSGGGDLSDMFAKRLSISSSAGGSSAGAAAVAAAAQAPGAGWGKPSGGSSAGPAAVPPAGLPAAPAHRLSGGGLPAKDPKQ